MSSGFDSFVDRGASYARVTLDSPVISTLATISDNQFGVLNGTTNVTCVPQPGHGAAFNVVGISVPNKSGAAIVVNLYYNDGTGTVRLIDTISVADDTSYSSTRVFPNGILVRDYGSLELDLDAAGTPTFFAEWNVAAHSGGQVNPL
jgi:hypothetical protein